MSSLRCWAFVWLNDCANGDEADFTFVQTQKNAKSLLRSLRKRVNAYLLHASYGKFLIISHGNFALIANVSIVKWNTVEISPNRVWRTRICPVTHLTYLRVISLIIIMSYFIFSDPNNIVLTWVCWTCQDHLSVLDNSRKTSLISFFNTWMTLSSSWWSLIF